MRSCLPRLFCFFFNDTATTEIYTLSLHDALPIYSRFGFVTNTASGNVSSYTIGSDGALMLLKDRKSTRLNSSHLVISYAVFCLKKKKPTTTPHRCHRCRHELTPQPRVPRRRVNSH